MKGLWPPVGIIQKNKDWNSCIVSKLSFFLHAGRHHPEEQGLKPETENKKEVTEAMPVGIIQKNKDWNWNALQQ